MPPIVATPELGSGERAALARLEDLRRELRMHLHQEPRRWVGSTRRALAARQVAGSTAIEGFAASVEDALAAADGTQMQADPETELAVRGYRRAMSYVLALAADPYVSYDVNLLRGLHRTMTDGLDARPGLWRLGGIWVGRFEGPPAHDVHGLVAALAEHLNADAGATPSLVLAAMAHLNLVLIHPFKDGNGRMSRCLQTLVVARDGLLAPEFSSIEEFLASSGPGWDNTRDYFDVLGEVGGSGETVTVNTATRDLSAMIRLGLLVATGRNRGSAYVAGEPLRALRREIEVDRQPFDTEHLFDA